MQSKGKYKKTKIEGKYYLVHRLVWEEAHGPIPEGHDVHHKDHNRSNNSLGNLEIRERSAHGRKHSKYYIEQPDGTWLKQCSDCGEVKEISAFHRRKGRADDSVQNKCKECANAYNRRRYAEQADVRQNKVQAVRKYREENPEKARTSCRDSYQKHKKERTEKQRVYNQKRRKEL